MNIKIIIDTSGSMAVSWKMSLVRDLCRFVSDISLLDERFKDTNITFLSWNESINNIVPLDEQGCLTVEYTGKSDFGVIEHYLNGSDCYVLVTDGSCDLRKSDCGKLVCILIGDEAETERVNLKIRMFPASDIYAALEYLLMRSMYV